MATFTLHDMLWMMFHSCCFTRYFFLQPLTGWWFQPPETYQSVRLDHHPNYWGKYFSHVPNHQPVKKTTVSDDACCTERMQIRTGSSVMGPGISSCSKWTLEPRGNLLKSVGPKAVQWAKQSLDTHEKYIYVYIYTVYRNICVYIYIEIIYIHIYIIQKYDEVCEDLGHR